LLSKALGTSNSLTNTAFGANALVFSAACFRFESNVKNNATFFPDKSLWVSHVWMAAEGDHA
jgi:hypothetical protein